MNRDFVSGILSTAAMLAMVLMPPLFAVPTWPYMFGIETFLCAVPIFIASFVSFVIAVRWGFGFLPAWCSF